MTSFSDLELRLKSELIKWSFAPDSQAEFDISQVYEIFRDFAGPAVTKQVLQSLIDQDLIRRKQFELDGPEFYEITKELIDDVHRYNEFINSPADHTPSTPIPASDRIVTLSDNQADEIRDLIRQAKEELPKLSLSNDEHSQVMAQLDAADTLANAPTPLWDRVKDILIPLAAIAGIGSLIVSIIQIIG